MANLGYCNDEYLNGNPEDPPHWPYQLYVREARRMVGEFVWTEHDPPQAIQQRSIGLGSYSFDCHWVSLYIENPGTDNATVAAEGRVNNGHDGKPTGGVTQAPYVIPYDAFLPKREQVRNLLVAAASSMSHIRQNAVRMEPTWMVMGHAAGSAAALALQEASGAVHRVNVSQLQRILTDQGQMIWP